MVVVQDSYYIPEDMNMEISTGETKRYGGVIRNKQGQIKHHLQPINRKDAILRYAWDNRDILISVGKVSVRLSRTYINSKKRSKLAAAEFRDSLKIYQEAWHKDALTLEMISDLIERLDEIKKHANSEKVFITLSIDELHTLFKQIFEFTRKLADEKAIEFDISLEIIYTQIENPFNYLKLSLETQKNFMDVAS